MVAALVEHDLERSDPQDQESEADLVNHGGRGRIRLAAQEIEHGKAARRGHRHLDEEDPLPAYSVTNDPAQDRAGDRPDERRHRPDHRGQCRLLWREDAQQQHLREWHDRAPAQTEQDAAGDQHAK